MAYTFGRIQGLFQQPDQKVDIFGQPDAGQQQAGQQGASSAPGGAKTSLEGQVGGSAQGGGDTTQGGESAKPQDITAPSAAAMRQNVGKATGPKAVGQAETDIAGAEQGLQQEANQYVQGYANKDYGMAAEDVGKAVSGDQDYFKKTMARLKQTGAPQVEGFRAKTDTNVEDIGLMGSDAGLRQLLRREAGDQYNAGEGAFDTGLLRRNAQFNLTLDQLRRRQEALGKQAADYQTTKTGEAQTAAQQAYDTATQGIRGVLSQKEAETAAQAHQRALEENQARQALREKGNQALIDQETKAALEHAKQLLQTGDPRALKYLEANLSNPSSYYKVGGDVGDQDAYTDELAGQFNRIQDLLGTGKSAAAGKFSPREEFQRGEYEKAIIGGATGKRAARDTQLDKEHDEVINRAKAKVAEFNKDRDKKGAEAIQGDVVNLKNELAQKYGEWVKDLDFSPDKYVTKNKSVGWQAVLSPEEKAALNKNREERGSSTRYQENKTLGEAHGFDRAGYKQDMEGMVKQISQRLSQQQSNREGARNVAGTPLTKDQVRLINEKIKNLQRGDYQSRKDFSDYISNNEGIKGLLESVTNPIGQGMDEFGNFIGDATNAGARAYSGFTGGGW